MKRTIIYLPHILLILLFYSLPSFAQQPTDKELNGRFESKDLDVQVWVKRFEDEGREVYDYRNEIVNAIGLQPGQAIADVGAGTGLFEPLFANKVGSSGTVYAVDISPNFIQYIKERARERGLTQVKTILNSERSAELPANSVDFVFVCDTYHHFVYYQDMLASIHSALRAGGQLIIVEFDKVPGKSPAFIMQHVRATKQEVTAEVEAAGFKLSEEIPIAGLKQNFMRRFVRQ